VINSGDTFNDSIEEMAQVSPIRGTGNQSSGWAENYQMIRIYKWWVRLRVEGCALTYPAGGSPFILEDKRTAKSFSDFPFAKGRSAYIPDVANKKICMIVLFLSVSSAPDQVDAARGQNRN
jgi:hypothetical protein